MLNEPLLWTFKENTIRAIPHCRDLWSLKVHFIINKVHFIIIFCLSHENRCLWTGGGWEVWGVQYRLESQTDGSLLAFISYVRLGKLLNISEALVFSFVKWDNIYALWNCANRPGIEYGAPMGVAVVTVNLILGPSIHIWWTWSLDWLVINCPVIVKEPG